jgi:hypothetical protein
MSNSNLKKPDPQFLAYAATINKVCHVNATAYGLDPNELTTFDTLLAAANSTYAANVDESTRNIATSVVKKAAFAELKNFLGMFINALEGNSKVPDTDIALMGLRPRHPQGHHPLPPPTDQLVMSLDAQNDEITVYVARPEHDQPTSTVAPERHFGFILRYKMEGDADADYKTVVSSRLHHTLYFEHADEGKRILLSAAWVNHRMEPGPWSKEISQVIN